MRRFLILSLLCLIVLTVAAACDTPSPTPVSVTSPLTAAPTGGAQSTLTAPVPRPTVTELPDGYPLASPVLPTTASGYPPPSTPVATVPPAGYPASSTSAFVPVSTFPWPSPPPTPSPTPLPPLQVAPTPTLAANAIAPGNAAALRPLARITPPSRESTLGFIGNDEAFAGILNVVVNADGSKIAIAKGDGILVYDLNTLKPLRFIDTGSVIPFGMYFLVDGKTLLVSSIWGSWPLGPTFFDIETGQRTGMIRVPPSFKPENATTSFPSPDSRVVVIQQANFARFYEGLTHQPLATWPPTGFPAAEVTFSPDSRLVALSFSGVAVWEVATGKLLFRLTPENSSAALRPLATFSPDGNLLATSDGKTLRVWQVAPAREIFQTTVSSFGVSQLLFAPNGRALALAAYDSVTVWTIPDGQELFTAPGFTPQFSPEGTLLTVVSGDGAKVNVWDVARGAARFSANGSQPQFAPDSRLLTQVITNTFAFVDTQTGAAGQSFTARRPRFLPDGRLIDVHDDGSVQVLDSVNGQLLVSLAVRPHSSPATSVLFLHDGGLAISSGNGTVRRDALVDEDPYNSPPTAEQGGWIYQVALAPDGKTLSTASKDGTLLYLASNGYFSLFPLPQFGGSPGELTSVAFSPDGLWLAAGSSDHTIKVWDSTQPVVEPKQRLTGHSDWVWGVAFSPDGKRLASASADKTVRVWDAATGSPLLTLNGHTEAVHSVAFAPDGRLIVSAEWDGTLKLWDANTGELRRTLTGHTGKVNRAVFSRDGRVIASASADGTVRLWETATGRELAILNANGGPVWDVAFSWDGAQLAAALDGGAVQVWTAP